MAAKKDQPRLSDAERSAIVTRAIAEGRHSAECLCVCERCGDWVREKFSVGPILCELCWLATGGKLIVPANWIERLMMRERLAAVPDRYHR